MKTLNNSKHYLHDNSKYSTGSTFADNQPNPTIPQQAPDKNHKHNPHHPTDDKKIANASSEPLNNPNKKTQTPKQPIENPLKENNRHSNLIMEQQQPENKPAHQNNPRQQPLKSPIQSPVDDRDNHVAQDQNENPGQQPSEQPVQVPPTKPLQPTFATAANDKPVKKDNNPNPNKRKNPSDKNLAIFDLFTFRQDDDHQQKQNPTRESSKPIEKKYAVAF